MFTATNAYRGVEAGEHHDQRGARAFPKTVCAHVHRRFGSPLGCLGQRRVEELVAGPEDGRAQRHIEAARKDAAPGRRGNEAQQAGRAHQHGWLATEPPSPSRARMRATERAWRRNAARAVPA